jgi:proteasome accessory factor C
MSESSLDRTSRALDLIPFVTKNPGFSIAELADRFDSTPSQIFKDLEMLFMCGLPGYSHLELIDMELSDDYVAINNPQNLDLPRKFSFQEIASLTLGLQALLPIAQDPEITKRITGLMARLIAMVAEGERTQLELFSVQSEVLKGEWDEIIATAALRKIALSIDYLSARTDSLSTRTIFPEFTYGSRGYLYTKALCTLSGEMRHFRHDRIIKAQEVPDAIRPTQIQNSTQKVESIRVVLSRRNLFFIESHPTIVTSRAITEDQIEVTFELGDREWLLRSLSSLPGRVEVVEPRAFREAYHARLDAILALYR